MLSGEKKAKIKVVFRGRLMTKSKDNQGKFDGVAGFEVGFEEVSFKCQTCTKLEEATSEEFSVK